MKFYLILIFTYTSSSFCSNRPLGPDGKPMSTGEMIAEMELKLSTLATKSIEGMNEKIERNIKKIKQHQETIASLRALIKKLEKSIRSKSKKLGKTDLQNQDIENETSTKDKFLSEKTRLLQIIKELDKKNKKLRLSARGLSANVFGDDN